MTETKRRHYWSDMNRHNLIWTGQCGCAYTVGSTDRERVEREISNHIIRANAANRLKEKGKPMITHHDITRRIYELEIPASSTLAELERAIDTLKLHAEKSEEIVAGDATYTVRDGRDPGDRVIVLSYSVNLG